MIEAVVFDVGRVLFQWQLRALFEKLTSDPDELDFLLSEVITEEWHFQHDAGRPLIDMVAERVGEFPEHARFIEAYRLRFNETIPGPVEGSLQIVRELDAEGIPLFAITNFGAEFWDGFCPTQPIFDLFRDIVVSGKERLTKPDPAIFALAADRFECDPSTMLFVDDNAANVASARIGGWETHHFIDAPTLRSDLIERGLLARQRKKAFGALSEGPQTTRWRGGWYGNCSWSGVAACQILGFQLFAIGGEIGDGTGLAEQVAADPQWPVYPSFGDANGVIAAPNLISCDCAIGLGRFYQFGAVKRDF